VPPVVRQGGEARLVIEDPEQRRQLAALIPDLAALAEVPASAVRRITMLGASLVVLVAAFWGVIDYGTEYAAPWLPYSLQVKLGETVYGELAADKDECHGKGLAAINDLANELARAAGYPKTYEFSTLEAWDGALPHILWEAGPILVDLKVEPGEEYPEDFARLYSLKHREAFRQALQNMPLPKPS